MKYLLFNKKDESAEWPNYSPLKFQGLESVAEWFASGGKKFDPAVYRLEKQIEATDELAELQNLMEGMSAQ